MTKLLPLAVLVSAGFSASFAQVTSVNGGSIQGTITDSSGAAIPKAQILVTGTDTGYKKAVQTDGSGLYVVGPLNPGNYKEHITAAGFQNLDVTTVIRTGTVTSGTFKLPVGNSSETIEVNAGQLQLNTEQAGVSDVLTNEQIQSLPINGRNFLDVAQIEPGVILQSGQTFDPTKAGYSAISVSGVSGRTTRIILDGQDITDEYVGTTLYNVSQGSISEFQLNRSAQDVSGDVTSTGQVLVSTQSGTNHIHGQLFYDFQDYRALFAAAAGQQAPFQRNQFGGSVGGPLIKDKLFFFGNSERIKQDQSTPAQIGTTLTTVPHNLAVPSPYRETYSVIRLDYNGPFGGHFYVRGNYNVNAVAGNFGQGFEVYANRDNTPGIAGGADFQFGRTTHSFRGSYEKFHNLISDASNGLYNPLPGTSFQYVTQGLYAGPNVNAPQGTFLSDKQFRYDGSTTLGRHNIKYGYSFNRIQGGGFAAFFGLAPRVRVTDGTLFAGGAGNLGCNGVLGAAACPGDPVNGYHPSSIALGNGLGFGTETSNFGLPGGGVSDWREGAYVSDSWKITPTFTFNAGVRWSVDTNRANQDIPQTLCSGVDNTAVDPSLSPCAGNTSLFAQYNSQLAGSVHQPYANFAPQIGFAYSPGGHKTVLNAAYGIFYENDVFNNTSNSRTNLLRTGAFFNEGLPCSSGQLTLANGTTISSVTANGVPRTIRAICAGSAGNAGPYAIALQNAYQAAAAGNANIPNTGYVGSTLAVNGLYGAPYRTPYSQQWNFGIQQEITKGGILRADYIHNTTLKIGQTVDQNRVGAARYLNATAARAAIAATTTGFGCVGGSSSAAIDCAIAAGANISDFGNNGLDSGRDIFDQGYGAQAASTFGLTPNTGAAFAGANPLLGQGSFILPIGKSGYDALQVVYRQVRAHPLPFVERGNIQISYSLSRIVTNSNTGVTGQSGADTLFSSPSWDNDNPSEYVGRAGLDHKHEVNFGGSFIFKYGPQLGIIGHFYAPPPSTLTLDTSVYSGVGEIFRSDLTGDGTTGDLAPGTLPGAYMHSIKPGSIGAYVQNFNAQYANTLTPAGRALVTNGLFTQSQLIAVKGAVQPLATVPQAIGLANPTFRSLDVNFSYPIRFYRFHEGLSLEPAIAFYNVGNFANYGNSGNSALGFNGILTQSATGAPNTNSGGITGQNNYATLNANRTLRGSGTFNQGGPRTTEFQLKLNF